jgi:hypothetical protein
MAEFNEHGCLETKGTERELESPILGASQKSRAKVQGHITLPSSSKASHKHLQSSLDTIELLTFVVNQILF